MLWWECRYTQCATPSSSSSSSSVLPLLEEWEVSEDGSAWTLLSKENSRVVSELMKCEIGTCFVKLMNNEKFLLDTTQRLLSSVHNGWFSSLSVTRSSCFRIRPSQSSYSSVFASLLTMGFTEQLITLAIEAEGEDIQRCIAFLLSLQRQSASLTHSSSSDGASCRDVDLAVTDLVCDETLPDVTENSALRVHCCSDEVLVEQTKKYFGSSGIREVLEGRDMRYLWNGAFRRDFLVHQSTRAIHILVSFTESSPTAFPWNQRVVTNRGGFRSEVRCSDEGKCRACPSAVVYRAVPWRRSGFTGRSGGRGAVEDREGGDASGGRGESEESVSGVGVWRAAERRGSSAACGDDARPVPVCASHEERRVQRVLATHSQCGGEHGCEHLCFPSAALSSVRYGCGCQCG